MSLLDELVSNLQEKTPAEKAALAKLASNLKERWVPNPGPQTEAYFSQADELLYGGEPGGGKSDLILGLAFNLHKRSAVFRREYGMMGKLLERAVEINGSRTGFSGAFPAKMRHSGGLIDFFAAANVGDEQKFQGNDHSLLGFDEATHFLWKQISFLQGWVRSDDPKERCRTVFATNPPLNADGLWVHEQFAPWINPNFAHPAEPGELRWFVTDDSGKLIWVDDSTPVQIGDRLAHPKSRTFIRAGLSDNPYYGEDYRKQLDNMDAKTRGILMGGFGTTFRDQDWQLIPTEWIKLAQERWLPRPPSGVPMCAMGFDGGGGGADDVVLASRYDGYFNRLIATPGKAAENGSKQAAIILAQRRDGAVIVVDAGGGYGMECIGRLKDNLGPENYFKIKGHKGAGTSNGRVADGSYGFVNMRSQVMYRFREALDPDQSGGSPIALPDDPELVADLTCPTYEITRHGIAVQTKEDVVEKLGRSPNRGDAVVMCWSAGPTYLTDGLGWARTAEHGGVGIGRTPKVNTGRSFRTGPQR